MPDPLFKLKIVAPARVVRDRSIKNCGETIFKQTMKKYVSLSFIPYSIEIKIEKA